VQIGYERALVYTASATGGAVADGEAYLKAVKVTELERTISERLAEWQPDRTVGMAAVARRDRRLDYELPKPGRFSRLPGLSHGIHDVLHLPTGRNCLCGTNCRIGAQPDQTAIDAYLRTLARKDGLHPGRIILMAAPTITGCQQGETAA